MKIISEYLSSKIKNIKSLQEATDIILEYFGLNNNIDEATKIINEWCKENNVNFYDIIFMCDPETYNGYKKYIENVEKKYRKMFNTGLIPNEICQYELGTVENKNQIKIERSLDIWYTKRMIAMIGTYGTIYCWKNQEAFDKADDESK